MKYRRAQDKILRRAVSTQASYIYVNILAIVSLFLSLHARGERAGERGFGSRQFPARKILSCTQYRLEISKKALEQMRALPKDQRRNIGHRIEEMREGLRGDVLKLQAKGNAYRLRVGGFRVLFLLAGDTIQVYAVKDRKEAYD